MFIVKLALKLFNVVFNCFADVNDRIILPVFIFRYFSFLILKLGDSCKNLC